MAEHFLCTKLNESIKWLVQLSFPANGVTWWVKQLFLIKFDAPHVRAQCEWRSADWQKVL